MRPVKSMLFSPALVLILSMLMSTTVLGADKPVNFVAVPQDKALKGSWSFVITGDSRGDIHRREKVLQRTYFASGKRCPKDVSYCPGWRRAVYQAVAGLMNRGLVRLTVHTGDYVLCGYCPPDWVEFRKWFFARVKDKSRYLPVIGNHEAPYLKKDRDKLSPRAPCLPGYHHSFKNLVPAKGRCLHNYWTVYKNAVFIMLCTGGKQKGARQYTGQCQVVPQKRQIAWMRKVVAWAAGQNRFNHVFVTYHIPSFACANGHGHSPTPKIGLAVKKLAVAYGPGAKSKLTFSVLTGHHHVTEAFFQDNVLWMIAGGGGAPQGRRTRRCVCGPKTAARMIGPAEYRWCASKNRSKPRPVRVNYLVMRVNGKKLSLTEHRLRDLSRPGRGFIRVPWGRVIHFAGKHGKLRPSRRR